jgi:hypothetical protein
MMLFLQKSDKQENICSLCLCGNCYNWKLIFFVVNGFCGVAGAGNSREMESHFNSSFPKAATKENDTVVVILTDN